MNNSGGGETVALTVASILSKKNDVDVLTSFRTDKNRLEKFFNLDLSKVNFKVRQIAHLIHKLPSIPSYKSSLQLRYLVDLNKYDLVIDTGTNGWFTKKLKTKTLCYVHFPYFQRKKKGWKKITNKLLIDPKKAFQYDKIICNSNFTKKSLQKLTNKKIEVIYPPVDVSEIKPAKKKNIIVTIGRFTYEKKHELMIKAFKKLNPKGWEFHLIGSFQKGISLYKKDYFDKLKKLAEGYSIYFHVNMPHNKVLKFLGKSKIYWHARGYGETDLNEYENFGITTVEAMAAGCVPIVINLGAQPEIVGHKINGFCWNNLQQLIDYSKDIIKNKASLDNLFIKGIRKSKQYNSELFEKKIIQSIEKSIIKSKKLKCKK